MTIKRQLQSLNACDEAIAWASVYTSREKAWAECQRGDWLLWIIGRTINYPSWSDGRKPLLACALDCAETVKHLWPKSSAAKISNAIAVLRAWIDGKATVEQAKEAQRELHAADAADAGAAAAYAADAAYAGAAAAYAADAAYAGAAAAYAAAAYAADAAYAARQRTLSQCADKVRMHFPHPPKVATKRKLEAAQ